VLVAAAAGLSPATAIAEREPTWNVFDEVNDPTPQPVVEAMLELAGIRPGDVVYDLGSGDGRIVVTAAMRYGVKAVGIDINPKMIVRARSNAEKNGVVDKTTFIEGDLFKAELSPATVITLFLWPSVNLKLRPRLLDLAPGTRVVSHDHDMGAWRPDRTVDVDTRDKHWGVRTLMLWIVPAKIAGDWRIDVDGRPAELKIEQRFQRIHGTARVDGRPQRIRNGRVDGDRVAFDLVVGGKARRFTGRARGDGAIDGEGWQARRKE
jgi:SAM-dependent methyltransferase